MCARILWRDVKRAPEAAESLRLTAEDLLKLGVIDEVIPELLAAPIANAAAVAVRMKEALSRHLAELDALSQDELVSTRMARFRKLGAVAQA